MNPVGLFIVFLVSGLVLFGAEVFVPGGVIGSMGGVAIFAAIVTGFIAFGPANGAFVAGGIVILCGVALFLWIKIFPRTKIGRKMMVSHDLAAAKGTQEGLESYLGKQGQAASDLRPAGFVVIEDRRVNVVTQGGMIAKGATVRVVQVEGNRVVVARV